MRNFIRTSHDQRRRSSAAATAEQLAYLSAFNEQRPSVSGVTPLPPSVESVVKTDQHFRRSSVTGDVTVGGVKGPVANLLAGAGVQPTDSTGRRRGSLTGAVAAGIGSSLAGVGGSGSLNSTLMVSPQQRRRWNQSIDKRQHQFSAAGQFGESYDNMEIRHGSVLAIMVIVCAGCMTVVLLAYALKSYL